ncbi:MAG: hypothetical protein ACLQO7_07985 [Candidatus Bathyarchaeia archaeon]
MNLKLVLVDVELLSLKNLGLRFLMFNGGLPGNRRYWSEATIKRDLASITAEEELESKKRWALEQFRRQKDLFPNGFQES